MSRLIPAHGSVSFGAASDAEKTHFNLHSGKSFESTSHNEWIWAGERSFVEYMHLNFSEFCLPTNEWDTTQNIEKFLKENCFYLFCVARQIFLDVADVDF